MSSESNEQMMAGYMTLRDYFAAKAMQEYLADGEFVDACAFMDKDFKEEVARVSYQMADAMMKARDAQ
jgi:hypothetical protein